MSADLNTDEDNLMHKFGEDFLKRRREKTPEWREELEYKTGLAAVAAGLANDKDRAASRRATAQYRHIKY